MFLVMVPVRQGAGWPMAMTTGDHRLVGYRVPKEWATLSEDRRGVGSLAAFKRGSRGGSWQGTGPLSARLLGVGSVSLGDLTVWALSFPFLFVLEYGSGRSTGGL